MFLNDQHIRLGVAPSSCRPAEGGTALTYTEQGVVPGRSRQPAEREHGTREMLASSASRSRRVSPGMTTRAAEHPQTSPPAPGAGDDRSRWIALYVLCAGMLMIVLDVTVVNVALPSIQDDLGFSTRASPGSSTPT